MKHICNTCGKPVKVGDWPFCEGKGGHAPASARDAEWGDSSAVVVFKKPNGEFSYPMNNSKATPAGCERIVLRSLRQVEQFEKVAGVKNEAMHYDRGSGRGFDDTFRGEKYN